MIFFYRTILVKKKSLKLGWFLVLYNRIDFVALKNYDLKGPNMKVGNNIAFFTIYSMLFWRFWPTNLSFFLLIGPFSLDILYFGPKLYFYHV